MDGQGTRPPRTPVGALGALRLLLLLLLCAALSPASVEAAGRDFYELLGVGKDATTRQIRQAFKKLALTTHPDKNPVRYTQPSPTKQTTQKNAV